MQRYLLAILVAGALLSPRSVEGQTTERRRHQLSLDVGNELAIAVAYARRAGATPFLVGVRAGYAFELNDNTFDREVWDVFHAEAFLRYQPRDLIQAEVGISILGSSPADDTNERRTFYGMYAALMLGYRYVFVGPQLRLGEIESQFGAIAGIAMRWVLPFGGL